MTMTDNAEALGQDIARHASEFAPRRRRQDRPPEANEPERVEPTQVVHQVLTPNALRIATQLDTMERERLSAIEERNIANARIEQFEATVTGLRREKETLEARLEEARTATELERNERIRLSDAMESVIELMRSKLAMPNPQ